MKIPSYEKGDKVEFTFLGVKEPLVGTIGIVDAQGTFFQKEEPSYDIWVDTGRGTLYKHVRESEILRKIE